MDQKQIIVHIGQAKAGSSTLQTSLRAAQPELRKMGIGVVPIGPAILGTIAGRYWRDYDDRELRKIANSIDELVSDSRIHKIILSSEFLFKGSPEELSKYLSKWFENISIVLCVRDPTARYMSSQQERLKKKHKFRNPLFWREEYEKLDEWQQCFPQNFYILPFQSQLWRRYGFFSYFLEKYIDLQPSNAHLFATIRANTSEFAEVTSVMQKFFWASQREDRRPLRNDADRLRHCLQEICVREGIGTRANCRDNVRDTILAQNQSQLMKLADHYGIMFDSVDYKSLESLSVDKSLSEVKWFSDISEINVDVEHHITMRAMSLYMSRGGARQKYAELRDRFLELFPAHIRKVFPMKRTGPLHGGKSRIHSD